MHVLTNSSVHEKGTFNAQDVINNIKQDPNYSKAGLSIYWCGTGKTGVGKRNR
jgi:hypothetical protein